ncbi:MAG: GNAT family N-acetyltransferase [Phycisphaerae bacterium]|nr:GNAT family N-acetyltransferase [Phycisphaerae bacterium]
MRIDTVFTTARLILRPFVPEDLAAVFARVSDPEVMRFHNCGPLCLEDAKTGLGLTIRRAAEMLPFGARAVVVKATQENVGYCGLGPQPKLEGSPAEISYDMARRHWGSGYATEAAGCLVAHGFEDLRLDEICAAINPANTASARVAQKLGFSVRRKVEWPEQGLVDLYVMAREEYAERS